MICAIAFTVSEHKERAKFIMDAPTPAHAEFTDNNYIDFTSGPDVIDVNNNRNLNDTEPLTIRYRWESGPYEPAFKMDATNADISKNVKISPYLRGTWSRVNSDTIRFMPESDWPADTSFTVKIGHKILTSDIRVNTRNVSFTTPKIITKIEKFDVIPDKSHKGHVIGVAVLSFNYPIDTNGFSNRVTIKRGLHRVPFSVRFDRFARTAIITTEPIAVDDSTHTLRLKVNKIPAETSDTETKKVSATTMIESVDNLFKISDLQSVAADDVRGNAQQLILVNMTTAAADNTNWPTKVEAYLLPKHNGDEDETESHPWATDEISDTVLSNSKKLVLKPTNFANPIGVYQYAFAYDVSDSVARYIYVRVQGGIESNAGFVLKNGVARVLPVAYPEKTVKIAGTGALLSLAGDKKLGIMARGGADAAYVNLYKVKSSEINHLITQTFDLFSSNIDFKTWAFNEYDMASVFRKRIAFSDTSMNKTNYASVDLGDYLDRGTTDKTGIFIVQTGASESSANFSDRRLILLTNLGIIRKIALDSTSSLFISTINDGMPAADIEISVLGRNGNAIWAGRTDSNGFIELPKFAWSEYKNEREPVAIVARTGDDVSFIPYDSYETHVDYSKFDIDGAFVSGETPMNAYMFSDRGIYRPGENAIIGGIIKNKKFTKLSNVPVKIEITDSRERTIYEETLSVASDGMFDVRFDISDTAPIGEYTARLYMLGAKNKVQDMIGTTTFRVQEFTPDNLKIGATIVGATENGWISPNNMVANITLHNLFGTPATDRRISAQATLRPTDFTFPEYKNYTFTPNFMTGAGMSANAAKRAQTFTVDLADAKTDANGNATFDIKFNNNIPNGTYLMTLNINGFEGASGTGVQTTITARVSNAKYLVGYHANSNLGYVSRDDMRTVKLIAIDSDGKPTNTEKLKLRTVHRENLTSLIKDYNDYYKYQTITRDTTVSTTNLDILATGTEIRLDTTHGGTYFIQITDDENNILANIEYFVADASNTALTTDTNAEMQIKLNANEYAAGDNIAVNITTPYVGTGLITIERDRVYAYKWFRTNATSSVQYITLPDGFEGSGYVNVSFVRDINSQDIFTAPYTSAVAPFRADTTNRNISIKLDAPKTVTNNKLPITYTANKNARLMIFAINTGILQVAKYRVPSPLAHFFPKSALQVNTYQILSLLLPEYKILREFAKTGGGDFAEVDGGIGVALTNPFTRKTNKPVAFYSGIIDAVAGESKTVTFDIPEYFNGAIRVFAVAANDNAVGSANTDTVVQSPIIVSTTAPVVVAPNDTFDINTIITNMTDGTTATAVADVNASVSPNLNITTIPNTTLEIPYGTEKLWSFVVRAGTALGNGDIQIDTSVRDGTDAVLSHRSTHASLSLRPTTLFSTKIKLGTLKSTTNIRNFSIDAYPEYASTKLYISNNTAIIARPLFEYLKNYEYQCTEQLVSRALPYALMPANDMIGTIFAESKSVVESTITTLKNRQNDDGSFDLWVSNSDVQYDHVDASTAYLTAYVAQFLDIAKSAGFDVPKNMNARAIDYMRTFAGSNINDDFDAAAHAFVIYILTRNGYITTGYIDAFEEYANENIKNWQSDLMGAYIATAYKLLKQEAKAETIMSKYRGSLRGKFDDNMFRNDIVDDAMYAYLNKRFFGDKSTDVPDSVSEYINDGDYSSYTSAAVILAAAGDTDNETPANDEISVTVDGVSVEPQARGDAIVADIPNNAKQISVRCATCDRKHQPYYTVIAGGFPHTTTSQSNGIEITREYFDDNDNRITSATVGDTVTVKITVRSRRADIIPNVVITDLVPGGFIPGTATGTNISFAESREDRVLVFLDVSHEPQTITYNAQIGAAGTFAIPPIYAASMYNPQINATGDTGKTFTVSNAFTE
ncbi:MAG: alpha-2-macroglobulin family protein [Alphaproteobacteria bacterium]|nr:alpha-2-macroglobulin family protein [Alphaproteobacteria bacterium]